MELAIGESWSRRALGVLASERHERQRPTCDEHLHLPIQTLDPVRAICTVGQPLPVEYSHWAWRLALGIFTGVYHRGDSTLRLLVKRSLAPCCLDLATPGLASLP